MTVRKIVMTCLASVVEEHSPVPFPENISDNALLEEFWLDSVAYITLLTRIEQQLGFIPKPIVEGTLYPATFGELVAAYQGKKDETP